MGSPARLNCSLSLPATPFSRKGVLSWRKWGDKVRRVGQAGEDAWKKVRWTLSV